MKRVFILKGLDCPNCSAKIEKEVGACCTGRELFQPPDRKVDSCDLWKANRPEAVLWL